MKIATPRFYINDLALMQALNLMTIKIFDVENTEIEIPGIDQILSGYPNITTKWNINNNDQIKVNISRYNTLTEFRPNYLAILGHDWKDKAMRIRHYFGVPGVGSPDMETSELVNFISITDDWGRAEFNGWSLFSLDSDSDDGNYIDQTIELKSAATNTDINFSIGSIFTGRYIDMPTAPNMNLNVSLNYNFESYRTLSGNDRNNSVKWTGPSDWGKLPAWAMSNDTEFDGLHIKDNNKIYRRTGQRTWDFSFSYLSDQDIFGPNSMITSYLQNSDNLNADDFETIDDSLEFTKNIVNDDGFFTLYQKTLAGTIPFIMQIDKDDFSPSNFALCKIKNKTLSVDQIAAKLYNIKLVLEEVI